MSLNIEGIGKIIGDITRITPDTLQAIQGQESLDIQRESAAALNKYRQSEMGLASARVQAELARIQLDQAKTEAEKQHWSAQEQYWRSRSDPAKYTTQGQVIVKDPTAPTGYKAITPSGLITKPPSLSESKWLERLLAKPLADKIAAEPVPPGMDPTAHYYSQMQRIESLFPGLAREYSVTMPKPKEVTPSKPAYLEQLAIDDAQKRKGSPLTESEKINAILGVQGRKALTIEEARQKAMLGIFTPDVIDAMTNFGIATGHDPAMGLGSAARARYWGEFGKKVESQLGGWQNLAANRALITSMQAALPQIQKQYGLISAFIGTTDKNLQMVEEVSNAVARSDSPLLNNLIIKWNLHIVGDTPTAKFAAALVTARSEVSRVLGSATAGGGAIHQEFRNEVASVLDMTQTPEMLSSNVAILRREMKNRIASYDETIKKMQDTIRNANILPPTTSPLIPRPPVRAPSLGVVGSRPPLLQSPEGLPENQTAGGGMYIIHNGKWEVNPNYRGK